MFLFSYEFVWNSLLVKNKFTKDSPEILQGNFILNLKEYSLELLISFARPTECSVVE